MNDVSSHASRTSEVQELNKGSKLTKKALDIPIARWADSVIDPMQEEDLARASSWVIELNYRGTWDPV